MSDTYINCPIIGDAAIARIAAAKGHPQQQVRPSKPWWRWLLGLLLTALLIAAIIWLTLQWFGGSDQFELLALPYQPT